MTGTVRVRADERDVLTEARRLIESGWCSVEWALDDIGQGVWFLDSNARSFCAYGALMRAAVDVGAHAEVLGEAVRRLASVLPPVGSLLNESTGNETLSPGAHVQLANDATSQATMLGFFDKALAC